MYALTAAACHRGPRCGLRGTLALAAAALLPAASWAAPEAAGASVEGDKAGTTEFAAGSGAELFLDSLKTVVSTRKQETPAQDQHGNATRTLQTSLRRVDKPRAELLKQQGGAQAKFMKAMKEVMDNPLVKQYVQHAPTNFAQMTQKVKAKAKKAFSEAAENIGVQAALKAMPKDGDKKVLPATLSYSGVQEDGTFKAFSVGKSTDGVFSKRSFLGKANNRGWDSNSWDIMPGTSRVDTKSEATFDRAGKDGRVSTQTRVFQKDKPMVIVRDELTSEAKGAGWGRMEEHNVVKKGPALKTEDFELWANDQTGAFKTNVVGKFKSPFLTEPIRWTSDISKPALKPAVRLAQQQLRPTKKAAEEAAE
eukprot:CAMPEP_0168371262 /NCGR_PEP_ID=MMETSP0228-20121227/7682_1 /TAXON_ID=133427 /ORGANISM="Protoceratium reticulatum, Strain CCCM 535 (=CCMP 1889)" /LENGTH=364 /DNA_ID=CAMNT_0008384147 /DNA_START=61 /DNA_END=1153 /DNA_ORIENTATION=-